MSERSAPRHTKKIITNTHKAIKAARLLKQLSRKEAAQLCGCSAKYFEQIENGRTGISHSKVLELMGAIGMPENDFRELERHPNAALASAKKSWIPVKTLHTKPRRNFYKLITKEARIIRILRKRKTYSQYQASELCGYVNSIFGQIENGRIELPRERIEHIVTSLGWSIGEFDRLMKAEVLRDEMIEQCTKYLEALEDHMLGSAQTVIRALMR